MDRYGALAMVVGMSAFTVGLSGLLFRALSHLRRL
jgi:hypothetical protein